MHLLRRRHTQFASLLGGVAVVLAVASVVQADVPRALPPGQKPADARLGKLKDLNGYFPFAPSESPEVWHQRAALVRRQLLVALGLWPMPTKTPANAVVHRLIDRGDYTVECVFLESFPGHFVTGNLYRPKGKAGRLPAILSPHGHWSNGRFHDMGAQEIRKAIVEGAERFEEGGRSPLQSRCVQLARMGCVVFHYDMVGYGDSIQLEHRPGVREHMNTRENWGYFSAQAELRLQHMMGLQTYNSIRALDWLSELPDVDAARIGVTGASGGGTQTFILCAIDSRPAVAFPAVMVSTAMQGGCTCENACYLRVDTGNIEIAALFAPKPLGMTGADDWTREIATKGLPELKQLYRTLGVEELVMAKPLLHFGHNYNYVSRAVLYSWFNKHLKLGASEPVVEEDYARLSIAEMSVWDEKHPRPPRGEDYERSLVKQITEDSDMQMAALVPRDADSLAKYREVMGGAVDVMVGRSLPAAGSVTYAKTAEHDRGDYVEQVGLLRKADSEEELPAIILQPKEHKGTVAIWIDEAGKAGLHDTGESPNAAVARLLDAGVSVIGVDLLYQGEFLADGDAAGETRQVTAPVRELQGYAGYTYGYNHPLFAQRVHDVLSVISFARSQERAPRKVVAIAFGGAGRWLAAARAQASAGIDRAVVDTAGFRFANVTSLGDHDFLPGGAKYLDLPGMLALSAPQPLWIASEGTQLPQVITAAYQAAGHPDAVTLYTGADDAKRAAAIDWLTRD